MRLVPLLTLFACTTTTLPDDVVDPVEDDVPVVEDPAVDEEPVCPPGVICIDRNPYTHSYSTTGGTTEFDSYRCAPETDESGPEVVYQVDLEEPGVLFARIEDGEGVDVDVHLLQLLESGACIDRGHLAAGALLDPGTYYVVVDSWVDDQGVVYDGDYDLHVAHTTADAFDWEGLDPEVFARALYAWDKAWFWGDIQRPTMAVVDFTRPSNEYRTWLVDLSSANLLEVLYTSHGQGSQDPDEITEADTFSNVPGSNQSSFGVMRGSEAYYGDYGYSMRIDGLEDGFNDNVRSRAIVLHRGDYATDEFVQEHGYCGRSNGCFVYDPDVTDFIVDTLSDGGMIFAYWPDEDWLRDSAYLAGFEAP
jgi:hypothetical protein